MDPAPWVGLCDGQAAFPVVIASRNDRGRHRLASVVVRAGGEIRDGFVADDLEGPRLEGLLQRYRDSADLVEVTTGLAAAFVAEAAVEVETLPGLPPDVERATDEILRHQHAEHHVPRVERHVGRVTISACRALCERPALDGWYLDPADLVACGIPRPPAGSAAGLAWTRSHAKEVADPRVRDRLASMAEHLARVLHVTGDTDDAALAARIAHDLDHGAGEPFLRAILERTALTLRPEAAPVALRFGDEGQREDLRRQLAPTVPLGRDLGALDSAGSAAVQRPGSVPGPRRRRPGPPRRSPGGPDPGGGVPRRGPGLGSGRAGHGPSAHRHPGESGVGPLASEVVANEIVAVAVRFREEVCADCPVRCWSRPEAPAGRAWNGPGHPAFADVPSEP